MISSLIISIYFNFIHDSLGILELLGWQKLVLGAILTTIIWVIATFLTPPDDDETLQKFVEKVNPGGPGWNRFNIESNEKWNVPKGILNMILGCILVYGMLIGFGLFLYGSYSQSLIFLALSIISIIFISKNFK